MILLKQFTSHKLPALLLLAVSSFIFTGTMAQTPAFSNGKIPGNLSYKIISSADHTWGYDILMGGKVKIHQPSRPAMPGTKGFKDKASATKVANLAIQKIKKGEIPPTITIEELKKLNAI
ncbi:MAG: DUF4907 domain-containing protein [Flavipsychrobacter sp.]|nr:DUF4907 domain-containing protein [Flavipsychrobacter sp.]